MRFSLKQKLAACLLTLSAVIGGGFFVPNIVEAAAPVYETNYTSILQKDYLIKPSNLGVDKGDTLKKNVISMFYPRKGSESSVIYDIIRSMTLGVMIIFFVIAGASLLLNKKPEESRKHLYSLLYIMLGGVLIYAANWLFGEVFHFHDDEFTLGDTGLKGFTDSLIGKVAFLVLSAIKAAAFFMAIIMTVVTGFKVIGAGEGEKGKKLVKGLINVVVALLVIKGVDFIYYLAADSQNFIKNASDLIINIAKVFGWLYGVITVIMVIVAGYLYITDGGSGSNFKKAGNILVNILLSALVLFGFLLIMYQIFAEFQTGGDAVTDTATTGDSPTTAEPVAYLTVDKNYV